MMRLMSREQLQGIAAVLDAYADGVYGPGEEGLDRATDRVQQIVERPVP